MTMDLWLSCNWLNPLIERFDSLVERLTPSLRVWLGINLRDAMMKRRIFIKKSGLLLGGIEHFAPVFFHIKWQEKRSWVFVLLV